MMRVSCQRCGYVTAPGSDADAAVEAWEQSRPEMCPHCGQARLETDAEATA